MSLFDMMKNNYCTSGKLEQFMEKHHPVGESWPPSPAVWWTETGQCPIETPNNPQVGAIPSDIRPKRELLREIN